MARRYDFWTHGVAAVLEPPRAPGDGRFEEHRTDIGTIVEQGAGKEVWVHLPIPTPTIMEDETAVFRFFAVVVTMNENAQLDLIHVRSGTRLVHEETGSFIGRRFIETFDVPDVAMGGELGFGMAICFHVRFLTGPPRGRFELHGAGASFS